MSETSAPRRGNRLFPVRSSRLYWHLTSLRREIEAVVADFVAGQEYGRLVDFGCGDSPYRSLYSPHVKEYLACDLAGNEAADCIIESPPLLPLETGSVDIVLSSQVLEHVEDPTAYLGEAWRVLNPGGRLVLSTHGVWRFHPDPTDFWRWTSSGLKHLLMASGYNLLHFRGIMGPAATGLQLWQDAVLGRWPSRLRPFFLWAMQQWIRRADLACSAEQRDADACVYMVVAEKKVQL